jgi:hypothetical protein
MYSFDRNPTTGLPCTTVSLTSSRTCTYPSWAQSAAILAEYGTMQLEFKYLSHHTGERKYWDAVEKPIRLLQRTSHPHHLYPTFINPKTGRWSSNKITFGALGDSFYEYLIKQWLLTGKQEEWLRAMYDETMVEPTELLRRLHTAPRSPLIPPATAGTTRRWSGWRSCSCSGRSRRGTCTSPTGRGRVFSTRWTT